jgi:hypothetical protein
VVSRWLPTAAAEVCSGQHVGFVVDKEALGQFFSEYFGVPCQSFHQFLHHHNHPGLAQQAYWWSQCQVDTIGLHFPLHQLRKKVHEVKILNLHFILVYFPLLFTLKLF